MKNRIDINLYRGLEGRLKTAEQRLEEKDRLLVEYVDKYYRMTETVKDLQAELAKLRALLSARTEA